MIKNYFKIAWRNLFKNKVYSFINIGGLALGMAVTTLIGLWIYDELSFDRGNKNYDEIAQVWQFVKFGNEKSSYDVIPIPMAEELRTNYPDFKLVSLSGSKKEVILSSKDKILSNSGNYVEPDFIEMMSLDVVLGSKKGLNDINSIMISESLAKSFFGEVNPINQVLKIDNKESVKVTGVYKDFPKNSTFKEVEFLAPWDLFVAFDEDAKSQIDQWDSNSFNVYAQLKQGGDFDEVSAKIKDIRMKRDNPPQYKPEFFLHPMSKWNLYHDFKNGVNVGGRITFVWLFAVIGLFVLLLACINFINLSTARSEKRAKEVGIRKAVGSMRWQLIGQFLSESLLIVGFAFLFSLFLVQLFLPFFNEISDKKLSILWSNPLFWILGIGISIITGLIAGCYPAFYLSSFKAVKVLKGTFNAGQFASIPQRILVVLQFTVSITLIIGTIIVFRQIQFAKNLSLGYNQNDLVEIRLNDLEKYPYNSLRNELLNSGSVVEMSESSGSVTVQYGGTTNFSWKGKSPDSRPLFMVNNVTHDYGNTIGWDIVEGRDFSRDFAIDTTSIILNEAALNFMGLKNPLEELVKYRGKDYKVVGISKDMIKENPFAPVKPSFFILDYADVNTLNIKLSSQVTGSEALAKIENILRKFDPYTPFTYNFVDKVYAKKFDYEERIGKLATFFAILAIFISCLGLFGMATFVAVQRTKEIGIRKVLGASVSSLWQLLSREFVLLVIISCVIATPIAWYFMSEWLQKYTYRTEISFWIFAAAGAGALAITLMTVSFQAIKAALMNPVKSLRSE